jgi:hypothetical protein
MTQKPCLVVPEPVRSGVMPLRHVTLGGHRHRYDNLGI